MKEMYHPALERILKLDQTDRYLFTFFTKQREEYRLSFNGTGNATLTNVNKGDTLYFTNLVFVDKKPIAIPFELVTSEIVVTLLKTIMYKLDYWNSREGTDCAPIP